MSLFIHGTCPPLRGWHEMAQIAGFAACALFVNILVGTIIAPIGFTDAGEFQSEVLEVRGLVFGLLTVVLMAPFFETFIGQWLPITVAKIAKRNTTYQILWSSIWFSILHILNGPAHVIQTFFVGWVLATCFIFCRQESFMKALRVTFLTHALHNAVVFLIFLFIHFEHL